MLMRRSRLLLFAVIVTTLAAVIPLRGQTQKRPLAIEDFYRVLTITNPQISDDGKTVRFSVTTRVESDNSSKTETFTVGTDGTGVPEKLASTTGDGREAPPESGGGRGSARSGRVSRAPT